MKDESGTPHSALRTPHSATRLAPKYKIELHLAYANAVAVAEAGGHASRQAAVVEEAAVGAA